MHLRGLPTKRSCDVVAMLGVQNVTMITIVYVKRSIHEETLVEVNEI